MNFEELQCPRCLHEFDSQEHVPHMIPSCGHTICSLCVQSFLDSPETLNEFICPEDKVPIQIQGKDLNSFPKNVILIRLVERKRTLANGTFAEDIKSTSTSKTTPRKSFTPKKVESKENEENIPPTNQEVHIVAKPEVPLNCPEHGRRLEIVCLDHKCRICTNCALFGQHKGHFVKTEEEVLKEITMRGECLIDMYDLVEKSQTLLSDEDVFSKFINKVSNKKNEIFSLVHNQFDTYIAYLRQQEESILSELGQKFNEIQAKLQEVKSLPTPTQEIVGKWKNSAKDLLVIMTEKTDKNEIAYEMLQYNEDPKNDILTRGSKLIEDLEKINGTPDRILDSILQKFHVNFDSNFQSAIREVCTFFAPDFDLNWKLIKVQETPQKSQLSKISQILNNSTPAPLGPSSSTKQNTSDNSTASKSSKKLSDINDSRQQSFESTGTLNQKADIYNSKICPSVDKRIKEDNDLLTIDINLPDIPDLLKGATPGNRGYSLDNVTPLNVKTPMNQDISLDISRISATNDEEKKEGDRLETSIDSLKASMNQSQNSIREKMSMTSPNKAQAIESSLKNMKKKNSVKINDKFEMMMEGIRADTLESADFTGAELGDAGCLRLADLLSKNKSLKSIKLVKNKIGDDGGNALINALANNSNLTSLNLTQNQLSEKALDVFLELGKKQTALKMIYLNQNNISQRNVKNKVKDLAKLGMTVNV